MNISLFLFAFTSIAAQNDTITKEFEIISEMPNEAKREVNNYILNKLQVQGTGESDQNSLLQSQELFANASVLETSTADLPTTEEYNVSTVYYESFTETPDSTNLPVTDDLLKIEHGQFIESTTLENELMGHKLTDDYLDSQNADQLIIDIDSPSNDLIIDSKIKHSFENYDTTTVPDVSAPHSSYTIQASPSVSGAFSSNISSRDGEEKIPIYGDILMEQTSPVPENDSLAETVSPQPVTIAYGNSKTYVEGNVPNAIRVSSDREKMKHKETIKLNLPTIVKPLIKHRKFPQKIKELRRGNNFSANAEQSFSSQDENKLETDFHTLYERPELFSHKVTTIGSKVIGEPQPNTKKVTSKSKAHKFEFSLHAIPTFTVSASKSKTYTKLDMTSKVHFSPDVTMRTTSVIVASPISMPTTVSPITVFVHEFDTRIPENSTSKEYQTETPSRNYAWLPKTIRTTETIYGTTAEHVGGVILQRMRPISHGKLFHNNFKTMTSSASLISNTGLYLTSDTELVRASFETPGMERTHEKLVCPITVTKTVYPRKGLRRKVSQFDASFTVK